MCNRTICSVGSCRGSLPVADAREYDACASADRDYSAGHQRPWVSIDEPTCLSLNAMQPYGGQSSGEYYRLQSFLLVTLPVCKYCTCGQVSALVIPLSILLVQDTAAVLEDVRKIIAEQLGTDQDKVRYW